MFQCKFRLADGVLTGSSKWPPLRHDAVTEIVVAMPNIPDRDTTRLNATQDGVRPATAQEISDLEDEDKNKEAEVELDAAINKALRDVFMNIEARLQHLGVTANDANIPAAVRLPDIEAATNKTEYTAALKSMVKGYLGS